MCGIMYDCYSLSGKIVDKRPEYRTIATSCQQKPVQNAQDMLQLEETEKGRQKEKGKTSTYSEPTTSTNSTVINKDFHILIRTSVYPQIRYRPPYLVTGGSVKFI